MVDLKQTVRDKVGDISGVKLVGAQLLVATYQRETVGKSSLILAPTTTQREDAYQGKVGLILAAGPKAFDRDWQKDYGDTTVPKVGDWVMFRPYETSMCKLNDYECRIANDVAVKAVVDNPDVVQ